LDQDKRQHATRACRIGSPPIQIQQSAQRGNPVGVVRIRKFEICKLFFHDCHRSLPNASRLCVNWSVGNASHSHQQRERTGVPSGSPLGVVDATGPHFRVAKLGQVTLSGVRSKRKTPRLRVREFHESFEASQQLFSSFLRGASCLKSPRSVNVKDNECPV